MLAATHPSSICSKSCELSSYARLRVKEGLASEKKGNRFIAEKSESSVKHLGENEEAIKSLIKKIQWSKAFCIF